MTNKIKKIPKLRFPEFNGEWKEERLGYIGKPFNGLTGKTKEDFGKGKSYIQYTQIFENSRININNFALVCIRNNENQNVVKYGDIFFTTSSETPNEIAYSSVLLNNVDELYLNSFCFGYRLNSVDKLTPCFAQFLLKNKNFRRRVVRLAQGSTRYNISKIQLMKEIVNLPNIPEQTKIANFITSVDTKIEQLSKKKKLLGNYKKGLMQKIFSQAIRFKADDGSDFPNWEEKRLGNIGKTFNGLTGKTKEDFGKGKYYIQYTQIFENSRININDFALVCIRNNENQNVVKYGDIFFTTSSETPNEIAYSSVLLDNVDELYLNSFCFGYRLNSVDKLTPCFAQFLLKNKNFRRRVVRLAQGSTRYNISKIQLMKEIVNLPNIPEQTKIANFLTSVDTKIEQIGKQLENTKQYKKALLQQMFV